MKKLTLLFALLLTYSSAIAIPAQQNTLPEARPTAVPAHVLKTVQDMNKAGHEMALCQAYHIHTKNKDGHIKFEGHSDMLVEIAMTYFKEYGIVSSTYAQFIEAYNRNVSISLQALRNGDVVPEDELPELGEACADMSAHYDSVNKRTFTD